MAPCTPRTSTAGQDTVTAFDGAISVTALTPPPGRLFLFKITIYTQNPVLKSLEASGVKPPLHFHPYQTEFFEVLAGRLTVEIEGSEKILTPSSGELALGPGPSHRMYATPGIDNEEVVALLSVSDAEIAYRLDRAFFENWYGYQNDIMMNGERFDIIQVMCMFDAGDSYLSLPRYIPFGKTLAQAMGIVIGRWIGGLLGYKPFHPEWTTDWDEACHKMEQSIFQRRFAIPLPDHSLNIKKLAQDQ